MKTTVSIYDFRDAFHQCGRDNSFSYDGLRVLFEYLEEYEESCGVEVELDVIALCCEFNEATPEEIARDYGYTFVSGMNLIEWLNEKTMICGVTEDGSIVYQVF